MPPVCKLSYRWRLAVDDFFRYRFLAQRRISQTSPNPAQFEIHPGGVFRRVYSCSMVVGSNLASSDARYLRLRLVFCLIILCSTAEENISLVPWPGPRPIFPLLPCYGDTVMLSFVIRAQYYLCSHEIQNNLDLFWRWTLFRMCLVLL